MCENEGNVDKEMLAFMFSSYCLTDFNGCAITFILFVAVTTQKMQDNGARE